VRDGDDEVPAGDFSKLLEGSPWVGQVLEYLEAEDQVEAAEVRGQLVDVARLEEVVGKAAGRKRDDVRVSVTTHDPPTELITQALNGLALAATDVEYIFIRQGRDDFRDRSEKSVDEPTDDEVPRLVLAII